MPIEHLGHEAAELLNLTSGGEARPLNRLAELAAWQVPSCSGAHAAIWSDGEVVTAAATHPDLAELADLQLRAGCGPLLEVATTGIAVSCPDTLQEARWPEYVDAALRRGVRCSLHLVRDFPRGALVLSLFGVRPGVLDADADPMADALAAFGVAMLANATAYHQAQRTASQLKDAVVARSVVDQAKGILMHALGCDADDALRRLRQESQRRHVKVTEVATQVVAAYRSRDPRAAGSAGIRSTRTGPGSRSAASNLRVFFECSRYAKNLRWLLPAHLHRSLAQAQRPALMSRFCITLRVPGSWFAA